MLAKAIRLPLRLVPKTAVMPTLSGITRGMKWIAGAHTHGCWIGTYERRKQDLVRYVVKPGMRVVDVGANAGFYTLAFSRLVGPAGKVLAIEPLDANLVFLCDHLTLNRVENVSVMRGAVSDRVGEAHFAIGENRAVGRLADSGSITVPTITLDSLGLEPPDLVKIDIEGGELAALRGARGWIQAKRTLWLVALDDPANADACRAELAGYHIEEFAPGEIFAIPHG